ncbi:hypothetical protein MHYP_G00305320 [Metynnis hypsauchen]
MSTCMLLIVEPPRLLWSRQALTWFAASNLRPRANEGRVSPQMDSGVATMLQAGLAAGSALLLVLESASAQETSTVPSINNTTTTPTLPGPDIVAIVVPIVVILVVLVVAGVLVFLFCVVKKKRQTEGTYRPSAEEQTGARSVEAPNALKLPKEERLI